MTLIPVPQASELSDSANSALAKIRAVRRPRSKRFLYLVHFSDSRDIVKFSPTYFKCIWSDAIANDSDIIRRITNSQKIGEYIAIYVAKIGLLPGEDPSECRYVSSRDKGKVGTEYGLRISIPRKNFKRISIRYDSSTQLYGLDT